MSKNKDKFEVVNGGKKTKDCGHEEQMCPDCEFRMQVITNLMDLVKTEKMPLDDALETAFSIGFENGVRNFVEDQIHGLVG